MRKSVLGLGRAAVCDCGTPWTFLLPFFRSICMIRTSLRHRCLMWIFVVYLCIIPYPVIMQADSECPNKQFYQIKIIRTSQSNVR